MLSSDRWNPNSVTVTHLPTGITASCSSDRSQYFNRAKAIKLLQARIWAANNLIRPMLDKQDELDAIRYRKMRDCAINKGGLEAAMALGQVDYIDNNAGFDQYIDALT